jgi:hypothetical protein
VYKGKLNKVYKGKLNKVYKGKLNKVYKGKRNRHAHAQHRQTAGYRSQPDDFPQLDPKPFPCPHRPHSIGVFRQKTHEG